MLAAAVAVVLARDDGPPSGVALVPAPPGKAGEDFEPLADPFAWDPARAGELARRAAAGSSHLLYALSPGGVVASAERTDLRRAAVERAAEQAGVDADTLEGLVFLESAGRADARAPGSLESAVGLTQILAETGRNLLGMRVDLEASRRYTQQLARAERRGRVRRAACAAPCPRDVWTSASTRRGRSPAPRATSRSRASGSAARTWRSSPTTWASATSRACCATSAAAGSPTPASTSTPRRPGTCARTAGSPASATTPRTTGGSSPRRARSCGCGGRTGRSWTG